MFSCNNSKEVTENKVHFTVIWCDCKRGEREGRCAPIFNDNANEQLNDFHNNNNDSGATVLHQ